MTNKLYDKPLSAIYSIYDPNDTGCKKKDKDGFNFGWDYKSRDTKPKKLFYALGCSWLQDNFFNRTFINNYPEHLLINRSIGGMGNSLMIDILKKDINLLKSFNTDLYFLVSFSEVGRNKNDFKLVNPINFTSSHDYFAEILKRQHNEVKQILENTNAYITTSFTNNNFNNNNTLLDFCGKQAFKKPDRHVYHYNAGIYEYMKDRDNIFSFNHHKDIEATLLSQKWFAGHEFVDDTLHVNGYEPYEKFLEGLSL